MKNRRLFHSEGSFLQTVILFLTLTSIFSGLTILSAHAGPEYESYLVRPNILDDSQIQALPHKDLGRTWEKLKLAQLEALAEILEMYPNEEIYFLARDAELLYDLAKLVTQNEPAQFNRIHLLNVSTQNQMSPHLSSYLDQEGINIAALKAGKQYLLLDTGFEGTIPKKITRFFDPSLQSHFKTQLICSTHDPIPSTRVFLYHLNPAAAEFHPGVLQGSIISYEFLPRFTDRSDRFELMTQSDQSKRWEPVSPLGIPMDGRVSKELAKVYMEDLKYFSQTQEARSLLHQLRAQWNQLAAPLMKLNRNGQVDKKSSPHPPENLKKTILALLKHLLTQGDPHSEAMVRDYLDILTKHQQKRPHVIHLSLSELGLNPERKEEIGSEKYLIAKYPEWKFIFSRPDVSVPALFLTGDFQTLRAILDLTSDLRITKATIQEIVKESYAKSPVVQREIRQIIRELIENDNPETLLLLTSELFRGPHYRDEWKHELKQLADKLEPLSFSLSTALLADQDYPLGDPPHAIRKPDVVYTRLSKDPELTAELVKKHGKSFEKAWKSPHGLIWGDVIKTEDGMIRKMGFYDGFDLCSSIGARLPNDQDWAKLNIDFKVDSKHSDSYAPQFLPHLYGNAFWSEEHRLQGTNARYFTYFDGTIGLKGRERNPSVGKSVRCVIDLPNPITKNIH